MNSNPLTQQAQTKTAPGRVPGNGRRLQRQLSQSESGSATHSIREIQKFAQAQHEAVEVCKHTLNHDLSGPTRRERDQLGQRIRQDLEIRDPAGQGSGIRCLQPDPKRGSAGDPEIGVFWGHRVLQRHSATIAASERNW